MPHAAIRPNAWEAAGQSLAKALFGDPAAALKQQQIESELAVNDARTWLYGNQAHGVDIQNTAARSLPELFAGFMRTPTPVAAQPVNPVSLDPLAPLPEAPAPVAAPAPAFDGDAFRAGLPAVIAAMAQMAGDKVDPRQSIGVLGAMLGDDEMARRSLVAQGHTPGEKFAITPERADDIRSQEFGADFNKSTEVARINHANEIPVANIKAGADVQVANIKGDTDRDVEAIREKHRREADKAKPPKPLKPLTADQWTMLFGDPDDPENIGELGEQLRARDWPETPDAGTMLQVRAAVTDYFRQSGNPAWAVDKVLDEVKRRWDRKQAGGSPVPEALRRQGRAAIARGADPAAVKARFLELTGQAL